MTLAAAGDTWGIPGPTFLVFFGFAIVGVALVATIHRRILFSGSSATGGSLGPQQIAYLGGRTRLAVYSSIGALRAAGAIGSGPGKTLVQTGHMPSGVTPLDVAVYNAAGRRIPAREIITDGWVTQAVEQLREGLESSGMAVPSSRRTMAKLWGVVSFLLVFVGIARFISGLANDKPVGYLFPLTFLALILAIVALAKSGRTRTFAADKTIKKMRQQYTYLSPGQSPSYATYGATGAAMGVALFGAASLYAMDPAFAAEAEIQRISATGGSSGSSSDGGSSSSCSSGSSCSGGSSCGGGGGCGG